MVDGGSLTVAWSALAAPWVRYRVLVDGEEVGRIGYRRPLTIALPAGAHDVALRVRTHHSPVVPIDVAIGASVNLIGSTRGLPPTVRGPREIRRWAKENSIWLGATDETPPKRIEPRPYSGDRVTLHVIAVILFAALAMTAANHHHWVGVGLALACVAVAGAMLWSELARRHRHT